MLLYKDIKKALLKVYGSQQGNSFRRCRILLWMLCGAIKRGKSHLKDLGSEFPEDIVPIAIGMESRVKKVKRWLTNKYTDYEITFVPCIDSILQGYIKDNKELVFSIDGSEVGNGCTALMISLCIGKRALPVCWVVRKCKKGHFPAEMHLDLFTILHKLLKNYDNVVVLGDGEFDNHVVMDACRLWNWHFVFRTAKNTKIFDGWEEYPIGQIAFYAGEYPQQFMTVSDVYYTKQRYGPVNATVWKEPKWDNPICLLSNFDPDSYRECYEFARYYKKRWSIETLFGDIKSRGFNIHKSKLTDPQRLKKLLIIICIAYILVFQLGKNEQNSPFISKVTRKDRMDLSIFSLGKKLIHFCIKNSISIFFSIHEKAFIQLE